MVSPRMFVIEQEKNGNVHCDGSKRNDNTGDKVIEASSQGTDAMSPPIT